MFPPTRESKHEKARISTRENSSLPNKSATYLATPSYITHRLSQLTAVLPRKVGLNRGQEGVHRKPRPAGVYARENNILFIPHRMLLFVGWPPEAMSTPGERRSMGRPTTTTTTTTTTWC